MSWRSTRSRLAVLKAHVERLDQERRDFGPDYRDHGVLFCWQDGRPPHPDTITRRFKQLAAAAGLPEIDLHDVRHSYATAGRDAKIDWKALSKRIGHADVAFMSEALFLFERGPLTLVAGAGFEPATSGL